MSKETKPGLEQVEAAAKPGVDLETLLVTEVGQFGRYQIRLVVVAGIIAIVAAFSATEYLFTTARIDTRCLIPECESAQNQAEFAPSWILNAVPGTDITNFDDCQRFANTSAVIDVTPGTCPAALFNENNRVDCDEFVYENTNTIVYDYNLACDDWSRSLVGSVRTFGSLVALPITGFVSDRWGRRTALVINALNTAWIGIVRYWAYTYVGFVISQFFEAAVGSGTFSCIYILLLELVGPRYRVATAATSNSCFAIGQIVVGLTAWGVPNWRNLTLTLYVPQLLVIIYFWIVPESIRWYQSKGKFDKAEEALNTMARVNRRQISEKTKVALKEMAVVGNRVENVKERENEPWLIVQVFRHKPILIRCMTSPVWWITTTFVYYGLSINAVNMIGNGYLNFVAVAAVEIPGFWLAVLLMGRIGRRPVLMAGYWICAACQVGYIFISEDLFGLSLTVYLISKCAISMVGSTMYVYTAELYPTRYRHSLFGFSSMVGRIGSILAPLTPSLGSAVWEELPFVLFASLAVLAGLMVLITPETLGSKMPDTMEEAANIGKKKPDLISDNTPISRL